MYNIKVNTYYLKSDLVNGKSSLMTLLRYKMNQCNICPLLCFRSIFVYENISMRAYRDNFYEITV